MRQCAHIVFKILLSHCLFLLQYAGSTIHAEDVTCRLSEFTCIICIYVSRFGLGLVMLWISSSFVVLICAVNGFGSPHVSYRSCNTIQ